MLLLRRLTAGGIAARRFLTRTIASAVPAQQTQTHQSQSQSQSQSQPQPQPQHGQSALLSKLPPSSPQLPLDVAAAKAAFAAAPQPLSVHNDFLQSLAALGLTSEILAHLNAHAIAPDAATYAILIRAYAASDAAAGMEWFNKYRADSAAATDSAPYLALAELYLLHGGNPVVDAWSVISSVMKEDGLALKMSDVEQFCQAVLRRSKDSDHCNSNPEAWSVHALVNEQVSMEMGSTMTKTPELLSLLFTESVQRGQWDMAKAEMESISEFEHKPTSTLIEFVSAVLSFTKRLLDQGEIHSAFKCVQLLLADKVNRSQSISLQNELLATGLKQISSSIQSSHVPTADVDSLKNLIVNVSKSLAMSGVEEKIICASIVNLTKDIVASSPSKDIIYIIEFFNVTRSILESNLTRSTEITRARNQFRRMILNAYFSTEKTPTASPLTMNHFIHIFDACLIKLPSPSPSKSESNEWIWTPEKAQASETPAVEIKDAIPATLQSRVSAVLKDMTTVYNLVPSMEIYKHVLDYLSRHGKGSVASEWVQQCRASGLDLGPRNQWEPMSIEELGAKSKSIETDSRSGRVDVALNTLNDVLACKRIPDYRALQNLLVALATSGRLGEMKDLAARLSTIISDITANDTTKAVKFKKSLYSALLPAYAAVKDWKSVQEISEEMENVTKESPNFFASSKIIIELVRDLRDAIGNGHTLDISMDKFVVMSKSLYQRILETDLSNNAHSLSQIIFLLSYAGRKTDAVEVFNVMYKHNIMPHWYAADELISMLSKNASSSSELLNVLDDMMEYSNSHRNIQSRTNSNTSSRGFSFRVSRRMMTDTIHALVNRFDNISTAAHLLKTAETNSRMKLDKDIYELILQKQLSSGQVMAAYDLLRGAINSKRVSVSQSMMDSVMTALCESGTSADISKACELVHMSQTFAPSKSEAVVVEMPSVETLEILSVSCLNDDRKDLFIEYTNIISEMEGAKLSIPVADLLLKTLISEGLAQKAFNIFVSMQGRALSTYATMLTELKTANEKELYDAVVGEVKKEGLAQEQEAALLI